MRKAGRPDAGRLAAHQPGPTDWGAAQRDVQLAQAGLIPLRQTPSCRSGPAAMGQRRPPPGIRPVAQPVQQSAVPGGTTLRGPGVLLRPPARVAPTPRRTGRGRPRGGFPPTPQDPDGSPPAGAAKADGMLTTTSCHASAMRPAAARPTTGPSVRQRRQPGAAHNLARESGAPAGMLKGNGRTISQARLVVASPVRRQVAGCRSPIFWVARVQAGAC